MEKKEMLKRVIDDYKAHRHMAKEIQIHYTNGTKSGIGNAAVIQKVFDVLIEEAKKQYSEL